MSEGPSSGSLRGGVHTLPIRVYYEDTDFSGVVYHASYLRFMERGRTEFVRALGVSQGALHDETARAAGAGFAFVVRAMAIEFLRPARMDDLLTVETSAREVKGASLTNSQRVLRGDEVLVTAEVKVAFVAGGRATRIPDALRRMFGA